MERHGAVWGTWLPSVFVLTVQGTAEEAVTVTQPYVDELRLGTPEVSPLMPSYDPGDWDLN